MPEEVQYCSDDTVGFHGTTLERAQRIVEKHFEISTTTEGYEPYLGDGVYFFDNQESQAKRWARFNKPQDAKALAVIRSKIKYGRLLNLTDQEHIDTVNWFASSLRGRTDADVTLAVVIDMVAEKYDADVVKATRLPNNPKFILGTRFSVDTEIILAVRKLDNILDRSISWSEKTR